MNLSTMTVPTEHNEHEDCNCEAVGYAKGWNAALQAARRAESEQLYKGANRYGVDARYFEEKLRLLIRDLGNYQADELRRVFERLADATGAEPDRVSRMDVLSLSEAARCLGVAQAKNDVDAMEHWGAEALRLESAICAKAEPEKVEPVGLLDQIIMLVENNCRRDALDNLSRMRDYYAAPQQEQK